MDSLVEDPEIGGVLKDYYPKERVRTYIKDGVLNAYTKAKKKQLLSSQSPEEIAVRTFSKQASVIQKLTGKNEGVYVLRAVDGEIFVISSGTVLKWETALRKSLDLIANEPGLTIGSVAPKICLVLAETNQCLTEADRVHIRKALSSVGVKAEFVA